MRGASLDLARVEQHWALARIFTPLRRGERPRLDLTVRAGEVGFRVVGPWALGIDDLGVLVALIRLGLCPSQSGPLTSEPRTETGLALAADLEVRQVTVWETLVVETTLRELGRMTGRNVGGANLRAISDSLWRLATVTVLVTSPKATLAAHILGWSGIAEDGCVRVALHPHVAAAVVGGPATLVDLTAWRALHGEVARRLLVWLSAWLGEGQTRTVGLDTLAGHVWAAGAGAKAASKRRQSLIGALGAIDALAGWATEVSGRQASITRHRTGGSRGAAQQATTRGISGEAPRHIGRHGNPIHTA